MLALCFMAFLISCVEEGGTIIVINNYLEDKSVAVYSDYRYMGMGLFSYTKKYGPKDISANNIFNDNTVKFNVSSDANYGIIWKHSANVDRVKEIYVSGGNTVEVTIQ
jgi:hypothetical protein